MFQWLGAVPEIRILLLQEARHFRPEKVPALAGPDARHADAGMNSELNQVHAKCPEVVRVEERQGGVVGFSITGPRGLQQGCGVRL